MSTKFIAKNFVIHDKAIYPANFPLPVVSDCRCSSTSKNSIITNCIDEQSNIVTVECNENFIYYSLVGYPFIRCNRSKNGSPQPEDLYEINNIECCGLDKSNFISLEKYFYEPTSALEPRAAIEYAIIDSAGEYISLRNCELLRRGLGGSPEYANNPIINPRTNQIEYFPSCNDIEILDDYWVRLRGSTAYNEYPMVSPYATGIEDFLITDLRLSQECSVEFRYAINCFENISDCCWKSQPSGCQPLSCCGSGNIPTLPIFADEVLFDMDTIELNLVGIPEDYLPFLRTASETWNGILKYRNSIIKNIQTLEMFNGFNGIYIKEYVEEVIPGDYIAATLMEDSITLDLGDGVDRLVPINYTLFVNTWWRNNPLPRFNPPYFLKNTDYIDVFIHELGHALGIGFWDNLIIDNKWLNGIINPNTRAAYNRLVGGRRNRTLIPIEDGQNSRLESGSMGVHWEDNYRPSSYAGGGGFEYPVVNDIMLQYFDPDSKQSITDLTISFLIDQGFIRRNDYTTLNVKKNTSAPILPQNFCKCKKQNHKIKIHGHLNIPTGEFKKYGK